MNSGDNQAILNGDRDTALPVLLDEYNFTQCNSEEEGKRLASQVFPFNLLP